MMKSLVVITATYTRSKAVQIKSQSIGNNSFLSNSGLNGPELELSPPVMLLGGAIFSSAVARDLISIASPERVFVGS